MVLIRRKITRRISKEKRLLGFFIVFLLTGLGLDCTATRASEIVGVGKIAVDGQTIELSDGRLIRLESVLAPFLSPDESKKRSWPMAETARDFLTEQILGQSLRISNANQPRDRYGRMVGQVYRADGLWLNGDMIKRGLARVQTTKANKSQAIELLRLEAEARSQKRGIWRFDAYAVRPPDDLERLVGSFQLVEGEVKNASRIKGRVFLNFGDNWRTDFTAVISPKSRRQMEKTGFDPLILKGQRIRVRGWIGRRNGPVIEVDHQEQIQILDIP